MLKPVRGSIDRVRNLEIQISHCQPTGPGNTPSTLPCTCHAPPRSRESVSGSALGNQYRKGETSCISVEMGPFLQNTVMEIM